MFLIYFTPFLSTKLINSFNNLSKTLNQNYEIKKTMRCNIFSLTETITFTNSRQPPITNPPASTPGFIGFGILALKQQCHLEGKLG